MAVSEHPASRRGMLGLIAGAPLALAVPVLASSATLRAEWRQALRAFEQADCAHDESCDAIDVIERVAVTSRQDRCADGLEAAEARQADACWKVGRAFDRLLAIPAPHLAAAATKIELAIRMEREIGELEPLLADLRRLGASA